MRLARTILIRFLCLPMDLVGLLVALAIVIVFGARTRAHGGAIATTHESPWLAKRWPYSTTFGHVILMHPDHDQAVLEHELVHVRQAEAACVAWWALALLTWSSLLVILSPFAWLAVYGASCVAAWLAGRPAYRGSVYEEHARAEAER